MAQVWCSSWEKSQLLKWGRELFKIVAVLSVVKYSCALWNVLYCRNNCLLFCCWIIFQIFTEVFLSLVICSLGCSVEEFIIMSATNICENRFLTKTNQITTPPPVLLQNLEKENWQIQETANRDKTWQLIIADLTGKISGFQCHLLYSCWFYSLCWRFICL